MAFLIRAFRSSVYFVPVLFVTSLFSQSGELQPTDGGAESDEETIVINVSDSDDESPAAEEEKDSDDDELDKLRAERDRLSVENSIAQARLDRDLFEMEAEKKRLSLENSLRKERMNAELAVVQDEIDRVSLEIEAANKSALLESARRRAELELELTELRSEEERLTLANSIAGKKLDARMGELRMLETEFKTQKAAMEIDVARLQSELSLREKNEILRDLAPVVDSYSLDPFEDGVLRVSNRRITLSGIIVPSIADHVAERINYFNNQNSEYPIFLLIDYSPGGSVMAGYKILKAMEGSQAPVYVIVKSYAASMAAVITTMSERSFAYPNAILVHHQISWLGGGNLTQQREQLAEAEQWWRRLAQPVADKMGLTLDEFIDRMYKENSNGDWSEFADAAKELHWVDEIVETIWETSLDKNPDRFGLQPVVALNLEEKVDGEGNPYVVLPRLSPKDAYFIYNRDTYYRLR